MILVETVRIAGVVLGLWGAILTVPGAATRVGRDFRTLGRKIWAWARRRRAVTIHTSVAVGLSGTGGLTAVVVRGLPSPLPGDMAAQIGQLREFANSLANRIGALEGELSQKIAELQQTQAVAQAAHSAFVTKLDDEQRLAHRKALTINARGLPLVGLSILLSGLPDSWVGSPWFAGVLLVIAVMVVIVTLMRLRWPNLIDS